MEYILNWTFVYSLSLGKGEELDNCSLPQRIAKAFIFRECLEDDQLNPNG